ncbi:hypothetical protein GO988_08915 [Hymenobacter sp. HMF4947]|uniref:Uncharacterized protein n=1 Tax=Hymenobacter ginkgonis TaxID=2682976 RepID=A0A7K1TDK3_9BACT|nr:RteC domain-containing protein [Hymenobacter ginkgonis]MVN76444.1 hypothetical protein [Hymenobacter ginkgonis]
MNTRYPRAQPNGFWKHETNSYANELANQEAEDRAVIRLIGGRLWELKGDELLDAIVEEWNTLAERSTEEYTAFREQVAQQAQIEGRNIPFSDEFQAWWVSLVESWPLWEVAEWSERLLIDLDGFDTQREFQYILDILQDAITEGKVTKRAQVDRAIEWTQEQLQRLAQQSDAPKPQLALPADEQLEWLGTKVEFTELAYALIEAGYVKASSRAKAVATLANFFGVPDLGKPERALQIVKKRRERDSQPVTPMLDKLKESLKSYLKKSQL